MLSEELTRYYPFHFYEERVYGDLFIFRNQEMQYILLPLRRFYHLNLEDLAQIAYYLNETGIDQVGQIIRTDSQNLTVTVKEEERVLLGVRAYPRSQSPSVARELAYFHQAGTNLPLEGLDGIPFNRWPEYWTERLEQLEKWRDTSLEKEEWTEFDRAFIESFPYYLAFAENAIQYYVDLRIDYGIQEKPVITHHRFNGRQWFEPVFMKKPSDWVVDHPSRDLAEWIRSIIYSEAHPSLQVKKVLEEYERIKPISNETQKLMYARLLYPLHYIETIENYYQTDDDYTKRVYQERLIGILQQAKDYESFLKKFPDLCTDSIPRIDWL